MDAISFIILTLGRNRVAEFGKAAGVTMGPIPAGEVVIPVGLAEIRAVGRRGKQAR